MLTEKEWEIINNLLLELYSQDDMNELTRKLMHALQDLIPYTKGYVMLLDRYGSIRESESCFVGMSEVEVDAYLHRYYSKDYLQSLYAVSHETRVYRDTDILEESQRQQTEFFHKFLLPADIPYGCGILVIRKERIFAIFNLFRSAELGDFTDKEIELLNVLKRHVENMIVQVTGLGQRHQLLAQCCQAARAQYGLTERESEVLQLLTDGLSNSEICERLAVSISTVKKHIYHLFGKMQVKSRTQLIHQLYLLQDDET